MACPYSGHPDISIKKKLSPADKTARDAHRPDMTVESGENGR